MTMPNSNHKRLGAWSVLVGSALTAVLAWAMIAAAPLPSSPPPGELTLDLGNKMTMKLVLIPAGKFLMGSPTDEVERFEYEGPRHQVTISKPFYMAACEVTQEQYEYLMGANPSVFKGKTKPVDSVSWKEAMEFCQKLSQKIGKTVRLPTEAQWEYACRAGSTGRFSFGDDDLSLFKYGNYRDASNSSGFSGGHPWQNRDHNDGFDKTAPVGSLKPSAWGLYDMHGNVSEWCSDWYADAYTDAAQTDPTGPGKGTSHVLRGGAWHSRPRECRSAARDYDGPGARLGDGGIRVIVDEVGATR